MSSINKHKQTINKGTPPHLRQEEAIRSKETIKGQGRKNKFWQDKPRIDLMSQNTVVSFESLEDKQPPIKPRFASINKKFAFKSPTKALAAPTSTPQVAIKSPQPTHSPLKPGLSRPQSHKEIKIVD